jgi:hypothetical protein
MNKKKVKPLQKKPGNPIKTCQKTQAGISLMKMTCTANISGGGRSVDGDQELLLHWSERWKPTGLILGISTFHFFLSSEHVRIRSFSYVAE